MDFDKIYEQALEAGLQAGRLTADDEHAEPVYGWVWFPTANAWTAWLEKNGIGHCWIAGYVRWLTEFDDSEPRKKAMGEAMIEVFAKHGIEAYFDLAPLDQPMKSMKEEAAL